MCISISVDEGLDSIHSKTLGGVMFILIHLHCCSDVQENLMLSLKVVLTASDVPPNILQTLLNLAEFMEHEVEVRHLSPYTLSNLWMGEGDRAARVFLVKKIGIMEYGIN